MVEEATPEMLVDSATLNNYRVKLHPLSFSSFRLSDYLTLTFFLPLFQVLVTSQGFRQWLKVMESELKVHHNEHEDWSVEREVFVLAKTTLESKVIALEEEKKAIVGQLTTMKQAWD